ncbi:protein translocase subunit SecF [Alicyclobacillus tolerans]|uniref:Protein-export membrane protein SecF n=2 Tax=Alicyclobacillus tolerans TaxID=90970 RepID=A0ABT9LSP8_9BACL|nr:MULTISPECIES: protein translocase subunit SecF [Alicyclobacillus]MDP9727273.1 SecD/SecF fusion protein [Alicyclobacillus tengchongensis]SHJ55604.1 SecD/SecF fusion protein [Alicyclobacillus montanus]
MNVKFDIVRRRAWFFTLSSLITVAGLIVFLVSGFNLGTDFKAGSQVQIQLNEKVHTAKVDEWLSDAGLPVASSNVTVAGLNGETAIIRFPEVLTNQQINTLTNDVTKVFPNALQPQVNTVDPFVANQTSRKAVWAVLLASLFIVIYVAIRFEYRFALAGIVALLHDAFIVMSVFALFRVEVNLTFVAAVLTIVGYSINDTIVIFDRIRENMKLTPPKSYEELQDLVNQSLWQTMTRSINTVATVLIAALMLFFFGGQSIHDFTLALIVGLISGAYSSIFIAAPLWVVWRGRSYIRKTQVESA